MFAITVTDFGDYETPFETPLGTDLDPGPEGLHGFGIEGEDAVDFAHAAIRDTGFADGEGSAVGSGQGDGGDLVGGQFIEPFPTTKICSFT